MPEVEKEADLLLPLANVTRLMKMPLPTNAKVAQDAKEAVQHATSEFLAFIASEATDRAISDSRKTILPHDIISSVRDLGFDQIAEVLELYYQKFHLASSSQ